MDENTRRELIELSRRFYEKSAESFDATRQKPWPGWRRLLPHLEHDRSADEGPAAPQRPPLRVLDAGCGNGRFGRFLAGTLERPLRYRGVDSSARLLAAGEESLRESMERTGSSALFEQSGLEEWLAARKDRDFDLVVLFGVLHHIPSRRHRRTLLEELGARLRPGGLLVATWWMLHRTPRLEKKLAPWSLVPLIDTEELESGDVLLGWQHDRSALRYAHFPDPAELADLERLPGLTLAHHFSSDGPSGEDNLYRLYKRDRRDAGS